MRNRSKRYIHTSVAVSIALVFFTQAFPATAQGQDKAGASANRWHAKYTGGSELKPKQRSVEVTLSSETLELTAKTGKKNSRVSIPLDAIKRVDSRNVRPAHAALAGIKTAGNVTQSLVPLSMADGGATTLEFLVFGFIPTAGISAIVHSHDKYEITVNWRKEDESHEARFELSPAQYVAFVSGMQRATGKEWINLREKETQLRHQPTERLSIRLSHPTYVGETGLPTGLYQIVCLEREGGVADLVFIAGKSVNVHKIRAIARSEVVEAAAEKSGDPIAYEDAAGVRRISQVTVAGKQFQLKAGPKQ